VTLPVDLELRAPVRGEEHEIAALVGACDETYRAWAPPGWQPPPHSRELDRWRGRITDGSWWTRIAIEPSGRVVGLVCFTQALAWAQDGLLPGEPIPRRAHISAVFTHPDRWREGIAAGMLAAAEHAMREQGYRKAQLWTPRDAPARLFYVACGWRQDGRQQWLDELSLPIVAYVKEL
jgi:GNAT superfamily N-acetyltransferase